MLALMAAALAGALTWVMILARVARGVGRMTWVRSGLEGEPDTDRVAVIVPAHNEERVIEQCAARMREQDHPALRVCFVLDRCTDRTAALLRPHVEADPRLEMMEVGECPPEWAGKCHAAWAGARRVLDDPQGGPEWLIFTDADTRFDSRLIRAAIRCAKVEESALLSLLPQLTIDHAFERLVQPVASMTLLRMYPIDRVDHEESPRPFANGQFMLFRREAYASIGGHEAVRDDLLEDLAFARRMGESGRRVSLLGAGEMLTVSMYDRFDAFLNGWRRIFIEACHRKPWRLRKNALRTLFVGVVQPVLQVTLLCWSLLSLWQGFTWWGLLAVALVLAAWLVHGVTLWWIYQLQGTARRWIFAYPLGCLVVAKVMLDGARDLVHRRPVRWGGRDYVLEPR